MFFYNIKYFSLNHHCPNTFYGRQTNLLAVLKILLREHQLRFKSFLCLYNISIMPLRQCCFVFLNLCHMAPEKNLGKADIFPLWCNILLSTICNGLCITRFSTLAGENGSSSRLGMMFPACPAYSFQMILPQLWVVS